MTRVSLCVLVVGASLLPGCAGRSARSTSPYAPLSETERDPQEAQRLNDEAAKLMSSDPEKAEALLRRALTADLYHGPSHNNLGVLELSRGRLYEAASEFEWARKLMPGHPDPRLNLGIALERAGRVDEAIESYRAALEVYPGHLPSMQALARCQIRHARTDDATGAMLDDIAMRGDSEWRRWARTQRLRLGD